MFAFDLWDLPFKWNIFTLGGKVGNSGGILVRAAVTQNRIIQYPTASDRLKTSSGWIMFKKK